jgi:hypothetical protein
VYGAPGCLAVRRKWFWALLLLLLPLGVLLLLLLRHGRACLRGSAPRLQSTFHIRTCLRTYLRTYPASYPPPTPAPKQPIPDPLPIPIPAPRLPPKPPPTKQIAWPSAAPPPLHLPHFLLAAYASTKPIPDPLPASRCRRRSCHPYPTTPAKKTRGHLRTYSTPYSPSKPASTKPTPNPLPIPIPVPQFSPKHPYTQPHPRNKKRGQLRTRRLLHQHQAHPRSAAHPVSGAAVPTKASPHSRNAKINAALRSPPHLLPHFALAAYAAYASTPAPSSSLIPLLRANAAMYLPSFLCVSCVSIHKPCAPKQIVCTARSCYTTGAAHVI